MKGTNELGTFICSSATTASDPTGTDPDDQDGNCAPASMSTLIKIDGCTGTDDDFDGPAYKTVWPGSTNDAATERRLDPRPLRFTGPTFNGDRNFSRIAFEADLAAIEGSQGCSTITGAGCTNPPRAAQFYPIYTTARSLGARLPDGEDGQGDDANGSGCAWQFGGANIAGTTNTFGGTATSEFGSLVPLVYPRLAGPVTRFNDYRRVLSNNPCSQRGEGGGD